MATSEPVLQVDGLRKLRADLRRMGDDMADLKDANAGTAQLVAKEAARRAPKKTGRLADKIRGNRAAGRASVMAGGVAVPYAGPIHYGWPAHGIEANPFILEAAEATQAEWLGLYQAGIDHALERVAGNTY